MLYVKARQGCLSSPLLPKKLGAAGGRSRLFEGVREMGDVVRTLFLLKWISDIKMRREVTDETNKMVSYNGFAKWLSFGADVIAQNDPEEQQKCLRYNDLIAAAVILQNTVDIMRVLQQLIAAVTCPRYRCIGCRLSQPLYDRGVEAVRRLFPQFKACAGVMDPRHAF
ncbi:Tn3 family transposase [Oxalobacteraceae bacterium R-40]|uniref:Tn3 family transposase n=1 Tax=Keguizhuia sedimenti TaxID=3064264 RepID=A0ABU1BWD3_9BURK|nr:Tn3 family transposase [Oxalobacteraceae bacterium R-40]